MKNIQLNFKNACNKHADKNAIFQKQETKWEQITFAQLKAKAESLAFIIGQKNIEKGQRACIIMENGWRWAVVFFAVLIKGLIAVPISPEASKEEIDNIIKDAEPSLLFTFKKFSKNELKVQNIFFEEELFGEKRLNKESKRVEYVNSKQDDIACILYTSGTTAKPKGVMLTQKNFLSNCESIFKLKIIKPNDRVLAILPLHHALALTGTLILPVLSGVSIVYPQSLKGKDLLLAMQEKNPTIFLAVPQIIYLFHEKISEKINSVNNTTKIFLSIAINASFALRKMFKINLAKILFSKVHKSFGKRMRLLLSGGARLDPKTAESLYKLGFTIVEGYGLTETAPVLTLNYNQGPKFGTVGKAVPSVEIKIINKNEQGTGEVVVKGPNIMKGYYKQPEQTKEVLKDNWFYTGDLGYIDKKGSLYLTGRAKEVIVLSSGKNIFPEEIEAIYQEKASVKEMCVFDLPAKTAHKDNTMLWAVVVPDLEHFKSIGEVNLKTVLKNEFDMISRSLQEHKRIRGFSIISENLPRTLLGKIKRFEVKNNYLSLAEKQNSDKRKYAPEELSDQHKKLLATPTAKKVIAFLKKYLKHEELILPSDLLEMDLGIDSLGRVELASGLEKAFNIKIDDQTIGNVFTVEDIVNRIDELLVTKEDSGELVDPSFDEKAAWGPRLKVLPEEETLKKIDLKPGFFSWAIGNVFIEIVRLVLFLLFRLKIKGKENIPKQGPYILFANHTSYLDAFIIGAGLPYRARMDIFFLGFRLYFKAMIVRKLIKIGRIIALDFSTHLLEALRSSYYILNQKKNLCIFPEGSRSVDGKLKKFKKGFGILAKETKAKILPVCIKGAYEAWPRTAKRPKLYPLCIEFSDPIDSEQAEKDGFALGAEDSYEAICLAAEKAIKDLSEK